MARTRQRNSIVANASANLLRLAGSGIVALLLPPFLVRLLSTDAYSTWAILMQLSLGVGLLDFGIQTAVARFVAHADELNDEKEREGIVSTAFFLLVGACVLAMLAIGILAWQLPNVFRTMPTSLHGSSRVALLLMGGSFALGLPVAVIPSLFIGLQRNDIPAAIAIGNKFVMAGLVIAAALKHSGLALMAAAVAVVNLASYCVSWVVWRVWAGDIRIHLSLVAKTYARRIVSYSAALTVWIGAMWLISGLDLTIVGIFDYRATAAYAVAASLTNFVAQTQGAMFAALLPVSAVLAARRDERELGAMLLSSTRYGCLTLLMTGLPLILFGEAILRVWVGPDYASQGTAILQVLVAANVIRLSALPYSTLLLGTGQQHKVILSPIAEGLVNLVTSVAGAYMWGAIGVAFGTLVGAVVSVILHFFYNMPRTSLVSIDRSLLLRESVLRPMICATPIGVVLLINRTLPQLPSMLVITFSFAGMIASLLLLWNYGLVSSERDRLQSVLRWA